MDPVVLAEAVFAHAPIPYAIFDASGRFVRANEAYTRTFGTVPPPEYDLFQDEVVAALGLADMVRCAFQGNVVQTPPFWYDPRRLRDVSVSARPAAISCTGIPLRGPEGVEAVLIAYLDVTAEHEARARLALLEHERELRHEDGRELHRLQSLFAQAPAALGYVRGPDHVIEAANVRLLTERSLVGKPIREALPELRESGLFELLDRVRNTGEPARKPAVRVASQQFVDRWFHVTLQPTRGPDGLVDGILILAVEVTDEIRARRREAALAESLRRSEQRYRFLADAGRVAAESLDAPSILQRLAELAAAGFATYAYVEVVDDEGRPRREAGAHRDPTMRAQILAPNAIDEVTPNRVLVAPLRGRGGELGRMTLVRANDEAPFDADDAATAEELARRAAAALDNARLYREAQDAIRLRDEFLSIASHELKTPLTALGLGIEAYERRAILPSSDANVLRRQVKRLATLVDGLLDVTRISAGRLELEYEELDLAAVVRDVAARYEHDAERARSELRVDASRPVVGRWDRLRVEQVVSNLLSNAIKYGPGRPIELRVDAHDDRARITIHDEGIGIAPAALPRIFERFERGVSHRQYGGLGLGLYVARQVVEAMGGTIEARSEPGRGATFVVELPIRG